jgi:hypothetical protein
MERVMAAPTLDRQDCDRLPPDHSIEDHLAIERAALTAERSAGALRTTGSTKWMLIRSAGLGFALAGTIAFGISHL